MKIFSPLSQGAPSFWKSIYAAFIRVNGYVLGALSIALAIASFFLAPTTTVRAGFLVAAVVAFCVLLAILCDALVASLNSIHLPAIRSSHSISDGKDSKLILLLEPSALFGYDTVVSIYLTESEFEELIGYGRVHNIQSNGLIQVAVERRILSEAPIWGQITNGNVDTMKKLSIKPNYPGGLLDGG